MCAYLLSKGKICLMSQRMYPSYEQGGLKLGYNDDLNIIVIMPHLGSSHLYLVQVEIGLMSLKFREYRCDAFLCVYAYVYSI